MPAPAHPRRTQLTRAALGAGLLALIAWAFWQRYRLLAISPYPLGVDGYFYPIQLRALLEQGELYYPSAPLALWLMVPFAAATDPITGAKLAAALGSALMVWPAYVLGRRISGLRSAGVLAAILVASSAQSFYLGTEFVKNGIGLTVAMGYLCVLAWALQPRPAHPAIVIERNAVMVSGAGERARLVAAALALLAVALTHKLALVVAVIATIPPLVAAARAGVLAPVRRELVSGAVLVALALAVVGALAPERFVSLADVRLAGGLFGGEWRWPPPVLALPGGRPLHMQHEVAIAGVLSVVALLLLGLQRRPRLAWLRGQDAQARSASDRALVVGPALLAGCLALPVLDVGNSQELGFRLRLVAFVPMALAGAAVAGAVLAHLAPLFRVTTVLPFAVAFLLARQPAPREGVVTVHPAMVAAVRAVAGAVPAHDVIIVPERHIAFMVTWYVRTAVRLRPELVPAQQRWRLIPMAYMSPALRQALDRARTEAPAGIPRPRGVHPGHRNGLVLMREVTWEWTLGLLPPAQQRYYSRWPTL